MTKAKAAANGRTGADGQAGGPLPEGAAERALEAERERDVAAVQASVERAGIPLARSVEFLGKRFRISDKVGLFPLMMFADAAEEGMDTSDPQALAAMWRMLRDCIHADDWPAFVRHGTEQKCDDAEVMFGVCEQTIQLLVARPSEPPSGSSSGRRQASRSSTGGRSSKPASESAT